MKKALLAFVSAFLLITTLTTPVSAQQVQCAPRDAMLQLVTGQFGEVRQAIGLSDRDFAMELYSNKETGTWTLTYTLPTLITCIIAHGTSFEETNDSREPNL